MVLQKWPLNHNLIAFLLCKKAFIKMSDFKGYIWSHKNVFNLKEYA
jgi:hypothetical protein